VNAAEQDLLASQFARDTVRIAVASETTRNYFTLRALDAELVMLSETLATREQAVTLQRDRNQAV
jgi:multidrug efflux system outer membrane protein